MVRDMLRLAVVAVLAELDNEGESDEPVVETKKSLRAERRSASNRSNRVRNWGSDQVDWLFVERPE